jgi:hypothetical protein
MSYLNMCFLSQLTPSPASWLSPSLLKREGDVRKRTWGELENNTTINCSHYLVVLYHLLVLKGRHLSAQSNALGYYIEALQA